MSARFQAGFPGFSLRARKALWVFVVSVPLLALAALNTGNNALYLLLTLTMGAFVASGTLSRHTLKHLAVRLGTPREVFAGSPVRLAVQVTNDSPWLPATGVVCGVAGMPGRVLLPSVPPLSTVTAEIVTSFPRRGSVEMPPARVEVRLPLGFFVKSKGCPQSGEVLVYPRRFPGAAPRWAGADRREATGHHRARRRGGEVQQLREFRPGDDIRDIHWKQTARQQRLIVVERRESAEASNYLALDREVPRLDDPLLLERFEDLVSEVATAAADALRRGGTVGLILGGTVVQPASGGRQARRVLAQLALVTPALAGQDPLPPLSRAGAVYRLAEAR